LLYPAAAVCKTIYDTNSGDVFFKIDLGKGSGRNRIICSEKMKFSPI
jgi:hypothetical protein